MKWWPDFPYIKLDVPSLLFFGEPKFPTQKKEEEKQNKKQTDTTEA